MNLGEGTTVSTPSDVEVLLTRVLNAPRHLVFEAWTNPEHIPKWLSGWDGWTMPICESDLRPGGKWRFVWRNSDGEEMAMHGSYREITPPERLVSLESWGPEWPETVNTIVFTEQDGRTTVAITILYPSKDARDAAMQTGMEDGMELSYKRLDAYLQELK